MFRTGGKRCTQSWSPAISGAKRGKQVQAGVRAPAEARVGTMGEVWGGAQAG